MCHHHDNEARALDVARSEAPSKRRPAYDGYRELYSQGLGGSSHGSSITKTATGNSAPLCREVALAEAPSERRVPGTRLQGRSTRAGTYTVAQKLLLSGGGESEQVPSDLQATPAFSQRVTPVRNTAGSAETKGSETRPGGRFSRTCYGGDIYILVFVLQKVTQIE